MEFVFEFKKKNNLNVKNEWGHKKEKKTNLTFHLLESTHESMRFYQFFDQLH